MPVIINDFDSSKKFEERQPIELIGKFVEDSKTERLRFIVNGMKNVKILNNEEKLPTNEMKGITKTPKRKRRVMNADEPSAKVIFNFFSLL